MWSTNSFPVEDRTVVITGSSQGFGLSLAKIFSSKGANVVLVARNLSKLSAALKEVSSAARTPKTQRFHTVSLDLTDPSAASKLHEEVRTWNEGKLPDIVWANAGVSEPGLFMETSVETLRKQMDANYWTATYLAHETLKRWLGPDRKGATTSDSKGARHFVMTSSTAAFVGLAGYTPYGPCKAALRSLHDHLASEVAMYNAATAKSGHNVMPVEVHTVFPGTILTPGFEEEQEIKHAVTKLLEEDDPPQKPDEAAAAAIAGLESGKALVSTQGLIGSAMKAGSLMGSAREGGLAVVGDMLLGWVMCIVWIFVCSDLKGKAAKWGRDNAGQLFGEKKKL